MCMYCKKNMESRAIEDKYLFAGEKPVIETERNDTNCKCLCEKDIKSILTHEVFEANAYKVKGE